jgi:hypothetical protein
MFQIEAVYRESLIHAMYPMQDSNILHGCFTPEN